MENHGDSKGIHPFGRGLGTASPTSPNHKPNYMRQAISQAHHAAAHGEIPVGCVIVKDGKVLVEGRNVREGSRDIFGHAEIVALKGAAQALGDWRLSGCILYVTLEPCAMCAAACVEAHVKRIVFGAYDAGFGACGSAVDLVSGKLGRFIEVVGGVCEDECSRLLMDFFRLKRK